MNGKSIFVVNLFGVFLQDIFGGYCIFMVNLFGDISTNLSSGIYWAATGGDGDCVPTDRAD